MNYKFSGPTGSMEGDKGLELELSLGLACSHSSPPSKDSADRTVDTDERTSTILNDFRNFLNAGVPQFFQRTDLVKPEENLLNTFQQTTLGGNDSASGSRTGDHKRKSTFVGMKSNKKQETGSYCSVLQEKEKTSHISIATDEGSTGDNEDVAESEVEGSTSKMASYRDDGSRMLGGSSSSSFPVQTFNRSGVPYSITIKESPSASVPGTSVYPLSMQIIPPTNGGHSRPHATSIGSVPMTFSYSSTQIPDKDSSWGMARPQPLHSPHPGMSTPTSVSMQVTNLSSSQPASPDVRPLEQLRLLRRLPGSKLVVEEGSSSQSEGDAGAQANSSFPSEYPAIKPGIAAQVKFSGQGSFPNLPWVSTTGPGPNGMTISGVTYKYATQTKIVCACHGLHLSPAEFVHHATEDQHLLLMHPQPLHLSKVPTQRPLL